MKSIEKPASYSTTIEMLSTVTCSRDAACGLIYDDSKDCFFMTILLLILFYVENLRVSEFTFKGALGAISISSDVTIS
jgi:hypothetical protein